MLFNKHLYIHGWGAVRSLFQKPSKDNFMFNECIYEMLTIHKAFSYMISDTFFHCKGKTRRRNGKTRLLHNSQGHPGVTLTVHLGPKENSEHGQLAAGIKGAQVSAWYSVNLSQGLGKGYPVLQKGVTGQLDMLVSILRSQALGSNSLASETVFWGGADIFSFMGSSVNSSSPACMQCWILFWNAPGLTFVGLGKTLVTWNSSSPKFTAKSYVTSLVQKVFPHIFC